MKKRKISSYSLKMLMMALGTFFSAIFISIFIRFAASLILKFVIAIVSVAVAALLAVVIVFCMYVLLGMQIEDNEEEE